jgi:hypothetical protein
VNAGFFNFSCLYDAGVDSGIANSCGSVSGGSISTCPPACAAVFEQIPVACRNQLVASNESLANIHNSAVTW